VDGQSFVKGWDSEEEGDEFADVAEARWSEQASSGLRTMRS